MFNVRNLTAHENTFHKDYQLIKFSGGKTENIIFPAAESGARGIKIVSLINQML